MCDPILVTLIKMQPHNSQSPPPPPTKVLDLGASLQRRILEHGRWYFFYYKNNAIRPSWTLKHTEVWDETKNWFQGKRLTVAFVFVCSSPFLFLFFSFFAFKMAAPIFLFLLKKKRLLPRGLHWNRSPSNVDRCFHGNTNNWIQP